MHSAISNMLPLYCTSTSDCGTRKVTCVTAWVDRSDARVMRTHMRPHVRSSCGDILLKTNIYVYILHLANQLQTHNNAVSKVEIFYFYPHLSASSLHISHTSSTPNNKRYKDLKINFIRRLLENYCNNKMVFRGMQRGISFTNIFVYSCFSKLSTLLFF